MNHGLTRFIHRTVIISHSRKREQESRPVRESDLLEEPEPIRIEADEDQESVFEAEMKVADLGNLSWWMQGTLRR